MCRAPRSYLRLNGKKGVGGRDKPAMTERAAKEAHRSAAAIRSGALDAARRASPQPLPVSTLQYAHICDPCGSPARRRFSPGGDGQGLIPECSLCESLAAPQQPQESIVTLFDGLLAGNSLWDGEECKNLLLTCFFCWRDPGLM